MAFLRLFIGILLLVSAHPMMAQQAQVQLPEYGDKDRELKRLLTDIIRAFNAKDEPLARAYCQQFALPDAEAWFVQTFGEDSGRGIARKYLWESVPTELFDVFQSIANERLSDLEISSRVDTPSAAGIPPNVRQVRPTRALKLYEARFSGGGRNTVRLISYLAHVDGAFRFLGTLRMQSQGEAPLAGQAPGSSLRVDAAERGLQVKLVHFEGPEYPQSARRERIQGVVRIRGVIGVDGKFQALEVSSGHPLLVKSALRAVSKWRYEPVVLDGKPVEVVTSVNVVFTMPL